MKILHIINAMDVGGAQRLLSDLLPIMAKKHEVTLLVQQDIDSNFVRKVREMGGAVLTTGCRSLHSPLNVLSIARRSRGYDIVHVHLFPMLYWAALASLIAPMKLVYTEHSTSNRRRGRWFLRVIERMVYGCYQKIISISQQTQDELMGWLRASSRDARFIVVNNGVNLSSFQNLKFTKEYPHTLIMVSRFGAEKDQLTVIRAMTYLPDEVHVIFVGDGEYLSSCREYAMASGISDRVHFVGQQTDVASWLAKADIGVQSSKWEGFGLTAVEMMAAGLPVVASNVNGLKQVIADAGLLFEVGNAKELVAHVERLLNDKSYYATVAEKCRDRSKYYDIMTTAEMYLNVYENVIGK